MDTYVVGDIHGKRNIVEYFLKIARDCEDTQVIFLGDFMDSFTLSVEDQLRCVQDVLVAMEETNGRVRSILGNHEVSYLDMHNRCSGWNREAQNYFDLIKGGVEDKFETYIWVDDILITHAGLSQKFLDSTNYTVEAALEDEYYWNYVGFARGGYGNSGGIRWCDFNREFEPVEGLRQIFGHTGGRGIRKKGNDSWCIDCLDFENTCVYIHNNEIKEFHFDV
jgi:hypothetical protein